MSWEKERRRAIINDIDIAYAERVIYDTYGQQTSVYEKAKSLLKFGRSFEVGTARRTLAKLGAGEVHETYVAANVITHISSSSSSDTGTCLVEYHTISGGEFTFGIQAVTLAGQTKTILPTPCARVSRIYNTTATEWVGSIYVYEDVAVSVGVPSVASAVHAATELGEQQTEKAATTLSANDYWIITSIGASILSKSAGYADLRPEIRIAGGVFRPQPNFAVDSTGGAAVSLPIVPPIIVPSNADVRITATADNAATEVSGWLNGYLAIVVP